ncbi:MAG: HDOD domain-containing protein [Deltaproteobacteria bacterium]|jgi:putative nucleotidyltransferase with HDIG domain|nr:HDOD domain-containing protein [Deltaproteobacteria bacterium]
MQTLTTPKQHLYGSTLKRRIFKNLDELLPMPQVVLKAQRLLIDPNSGFDELSNIIETDQEITRNILNVANSAYYSLKNKVCSVRQASLMLGLDVIAEIIMAAATSTLFGKSLAAYGLNPRGLWQHSLSTALSSRKIAEAIRPSLANEAFLSGLFHDMGKLILDQHIFSRNDAFKEFLGDSKDPHFKAERQILGFDHAEVASEMCKKWKFPRAVTSAIRHHHHLNPEHEDDLALILYAADNLTRMNANGNGTGNLPDEIVDMVMELLALDEDALSRIMREVNESVGQIENEIFGTA